MDANEKIHVKLDSLAEQMTLVRIDIAGLKVKAGVWGVLGGAVPVIIGLGVWALKTL